MASHRSHAMPPSRLEPQIPPTQRRPSTRLPTRSVTPTSSKTTPVPPAPAKLLKKKPTRENEQAHTSGSRTTGLSTSRVPQPPVAEKIRGGRERLAPPSTYGSSAMSSKAGAQQTSGRSMRPERVANTRTPSLVSGSSISTIDSPRSGMLRRKQSSIGRQIPRTRAGSASSQDDTPILRAAPTYIDPFADSVLGISLPSATTMVQHKDTKEKEHSLGMPHRLATEDLPPPTPLYAASATPSTGYSESPTAFSHVSTPTSMSSYSPGLVTTQKPMSAARQMSPSQSRRPIMRRTNDEVYAREQRALSSVRESSTSSSSASTVRVMETSARERDARTARLPPPPQNPLVDQTRSAHPRRTTSISRSAEPASKTQPPLQAPPELAHLAVDVAPQNAPTRRPIRPSRDGTPELSGLQQQSPIIQSNMTSLPSHHRRTSSTDSRLGLSPVMSNSRIRPPMASKTPSRNPSPALSPATFASGSSRIPTSRGPTPDLQSDTERRAVAAKSATAPSPVKSSSRFGFFRRAKTEPAPTKPEKVKKLLRKGPMAGTGHEGYGKYGNRGRSGSTTSGTGSAGRSASQDSGTVSVQRTPTSRKNSVASPKEAEMDDYFRDRLAPVIIRGGSADICRSPEQLRSTSSLGSAVFDSTSPGPNSNTSSVAIETAISGQIVQNKPTLLPSAMSDTRGASPGKRFGFSFRRPSDSEEEKKAGAMRPVVARRSFRRSQIVDPKEEKRQKASNGAPLAPTSSTEISQPWRPSASDATRRVDISEGKEGNWLKSKKGDVKKEQAPKFSRKWNFFARAAAQAPKETTDSTAGIVKVAPSRSVPHYAIMDGGDQLDMDDIERIMEEAAKSPEEPKPLAMAPPMEPPRAPEEDNSERQVKSHVHSVLLPSPPLLPPAFVHSTRPASPKVMLRKEHPAEGVANAEQAVQPIYPEPTPVALFAEKTASNPPSLLVDTVAPTAKPSRPTRLVPLGRIPPVVSKRDRDVKISDQSFSRPFAPSQPSPAVHVPRTSVDSIQVPLIAETSVLSDVYPAYSGVNTPRNATFEISPLHFGQHSGDKGGEFLKFPPRKDSEQSCSSSSGIWSFPYSAAVASPPASGPLSEDEVWNEYDDLIDDVLSPASELVAYPFDTPGPSDERASTEIAPISTAPANFEHKYSHSAHTSISSKPQSIHLRRSRLLSALQANSPNAHTFPSVSDLYSQYGEKSISVVDPVTGRLSVQLSNRNSSNTSRPGSTRSSLPASVGVAARQSRSTITSNEERRVSNRYRDTKLIEMAENEKDGLESMANLRFGALMTSKWLSFGRVLFSPVHFDLKDNTEDRVLVIDGLGKDWSYYCALTYPEATIFNISSTMETSQNATPWSNVPNHKHVYHGNMQSMFPFPNRYFAAVVYRFPLTASEANYKNCIAECKRVLRPGGYLELSILDLDLINMGNRARRAMRELKMQMHVADPDLSLKPVSNMIMRLIGRKGFESINRCMVAVPVAAGRMNSWSSESSGVDEPSNKKSVKGQGKAKAGRDTDSKPNTKASRLNAPVPNFTDLLGAPPSPDPAAANEADANISDMVARVGRWWYSRCYENVLLPEADLSHSLWNDGALLRECENRGTSFRLLVAYAQKPMCAVRRTVSV